MYYEYMYVQGPEQLLVHFVLTDVSALSYSCCQYMSVYSHAIGAWERITCNVLCVQQAMHQLTSVQSDKVKCDASCHMA